MKLQIFSERCSGSNFLESLITANLPEISITRDYGRKHWITNRLIGDGVMFDNRIYIVLMRSPFDWIRSMYANPWHTDTNLRFLEFSEFIRREWKCIWDEDAGIDRSDHRWGTEMVFERNPQTGMRFRNICEMRTVKYRLWYELLNQQERFLAVNYDTAASDPAGFIQRFSKSIGMRAPDRPSVPKGYKGRLSWKREFLIRLSGGRIGGFKPKKKFMISSADLDFILSELDEELEAIWGIDLRQLVCREKSLLQET